MGLFDLLGRKPAPPPDPLAGLDADQPRCHHYTLAHIALRSLAHEQPLMFLGVLGSPEADRFLASVFADVSAHCREREPQPDFASTDLAVHRGRVGPYPCAAIVMPPPRTTPEAYFVAAVLMVDVTNTPEPPADATLRYFTLEYGLALGGPPRTVLCEWTAEGTHSNYGDGPEPELGAFLRAVEAKLETRK